MGEKRAREYERAIDTGKVQRQRIESMVAALEGEKKRRKEVEVPQ